MAEKRDYYEVLGVKKDATEAEIKSAFRKQAKSCHPDLHPGDAAAEAQFKELNEAAEVLTDPDKRAKYDQFGHAAFDPTQGGQNPFEGFSGFGGFGGFGDIFDTMFGGFGGSTRSNTGPVPGNDLRYSLTLTFEEAAFGVKKEITVPREENCPSCDGSGAKKGTEAVRCTTCGGTGTVRVQQNTILGSVTSTRQCSACGGRGKIIKDPCPDCRGTGRIRKNKKLIVNVPAGIDNGQTICLTGEGEAGVRGGQRGDLYVTITVRASKNFVRKGYDLYLEQPINFTLAALGGEIIVPTLNGTVRANVAAGTQNGTVLRLSGQGIQHLKGSAKGDLLVCLKVLIPKKLTDEQRELLEKLAQSFGDSVSPGKKTLFGKKK